VLDPDGVETGRRDPQHDAPAVLEIAPEGVQGRIGRGGAVGDPLLDEAAGKQRSDDFARRPASQRAGQRQQIAVGAPSACARSIAACISSALPWRAR
jgi:hypothetical protein